MNREEIEKQIEEAVGKERKRKKSVSGDKVRNILNAIFLVCAAVGLLLYYLWPDNRFVGLAVLGGGMIVKLVEIFMRFML